MFDTLAQIHLVRGEYDEAESCLQKASEAYGTYGLQASRWYEWSVRLLTARLALRRGRRADALQQATSISTSAGVPPGEAVQAELLAVEALLSDERVEEAEQRLVKVAARVDPRTTPGSWGEYLRQRAHIHVRRGRLADAYHDLAQSVSMFDLLGEQYQAAQSRLALGRLSGRAGARSVAERHLRDALAVFESMGARPDVQDARANAVLPAAASASGPYLSAPGEADDVIVRQAGGRRRDARPARHRNRGGVLGGRRRRRGDGVPARGQRRDPGARLPRLRGGGRRRARALGAARIVVRRRRVHGRGHRPRGRRGTAGAGGVSAAARPAGDAGACG